MTNKKLPRVIYSVTVCVVGMAISLLTIRYLLPLVLPIVVSMALSTAVEPLVRHITGGLNIPRKVAAFICVVLLLITLATAIAVTVNRILTELVALSRRLPEVLSTLTSALENLKEKMHLYANMPGVAEVVGPTLDAMPGEISKILGAISTGLLSWLTSFAGRAPSFLFFAITCALGMYFISSEYPEISAFLRAQIPRRRRRDAGRLLSLLADTLGGFLRAQFILICLTFGELLIAFTLMRIEYAIILALGLAALDALPVIGTGSVLIPWSAAAILSGEQEIAIGLLATYLITTSVRNVVQAGLVGNQTGLHPLVALAVMYAGFRAMGVIGLIFAPVAALIVKQLNDTGVIQLWKSVNTEGT